MLDPDRARRLAEAALHASTATETEVSISQVEEELNRFTADHPVQNLVRRMADVSVRVRIDGREGKAATGTPTEEAVVETVRRAIAVAGHSPAPPEELVPLPGQQEYRLRRPDPQEPDPEGTADTVARLTAAARDAGCTAAGTHGATNELRLIANSRGLHVWDLDTRAGVSLRAFRGKGAGSGMGFAALRTGLDLDGVAKQAVDRALATENPDSIAPGTYTVVLEPPAIASLLLFAGYSGFGALKVEEGSSFLTGKIGERVATDAVTVSDDAHHPMAVGHVFDGEGLPRSEVALIERGIARGLVHDRRTAKRMGCRSTGHALPQPNAMGPAPANLVLSSGIGDRDALIRDVDRGLLISEFHYTNMIEPTKLTLTGMTRNGTFLIEKGEVTRPVRNLRFTQSLAEALTRVSGLGTDAKLCSALFGGYSVVPSVRIDGFHFTSETEF